MKAKNTIRVCYLLQGTDRIEWAEVSHTESNGRVRFTDGNWNPGEHCFFTETQCRRYHGIPPKNWITVIKKIADQLEKTADKIRKDLL